MDIKRAKKEIKDSIEAYFAKDEFGDYMIPQIRQRPILLMGPPGIGKTQVMEQVAKECKVALVAYTITHHTRQSAVGLPFIEKKKYGGKEYSVTEYTMSEIIASVYDKMEETGLKEGILFIDEINCVSETLAPTMLQFLQCKMFGNQKIPEGWIIVAAGNPPEYNKSVRDFDVVTLDRIKKIDVDVNYDVWKEYAYQADIHPAILAYLEIRRDYFYRMETTVDGRVFATARGWEDLSQLLKKLFVEDQEFMKIFEGHSAAKTVHHGFIGGLMEHTLGVTRLCDYMANAYPLLNRDLLITTALLHDVGKTKELSAFPMNDYTDEGQLLGHIVIGAQMVHDLAKEIPDFPEKLENQVIHCILAHHGELEYGSPKKPALAEAVALNLADNTDARMETLTEIFHADKGKKEWLGFNRIFESNLRRTGDI